VNVTAWYQKRGVGFIMERARKLNERYSFDPQKAVDRIDSCVAALRGYGCSPTFAVPGMVVERHVSFFQHLQEIGAELAVHGYNHIDLKACPPEEGSRQLQHAAEIFRANRLEVHGFRCPYLSASDELLKAIPAGIFAYSSNKSIQWPLDVTANLPESNLYETIRGFYSPENAETFPCLPWFQDGLVEIPVCVPDDLQLHDGFGFGAEQISQIWSHILHQTHQRGEVFNLMFHPELASFVEAPFLSVLQEARSLSPSVWLARLCDVSAWWIEKSGFSVETEWEQDHFNVRFHCTPRATILCRGFDPKVPTISWDQNFSRLETQSFRLDEPVLPFIGLPPDAPQWIVSALLGMGYILDMSPTSQQCSIFLDEDCLRRISNPIELNVHIERNCTRLVRFWPWPDGARSALCITGDLDALSLLDYALRLLKK
jgi:peptidoglycan/xylan/chitin deacetylase (PgdA/CDA1 family)